MKDVTVVDAMMETTDALLRTIVRHCGFALHFQLTKQPEGAIPRVVAEFHGPDTALLLADRGALLHALEHVAAKALRLREDQHDWLQFDAENFQARRTQELAAMAEAGLEQVRTTGRPYRFPAMSSRERRSLHLLLASPGLSTGSEGEGAARHLVLRQQG